MTLIGNINVKVLAGDMTVMPTDAYVVPQFTYAASSGGVGGAVAHAGGVGGLKQYQEFINQQGEQPFGKVLLTESGGGNARYHLHVVSVGSPPQDEFNTVQTAMFNALSTAAQNGIQSIIAPAMGTGIIGKLTPEQSAKAMMSAVQAFVSQGNSEIQEVTFVIFRDIPAVQAFAAVLESGSFSTAQKEAGQAEPSFGKKK